MNDRMRAIALGVHLFKNDRQHFTDILRDVPAFAGDYQLFARACHYYRDHLRLPNDQGGLDEPPPLVATPEGVYTIFPTPIELIDWTLKMVRHVTTRNETAESVLSHARADAGIISSSSDSDGFDRMLRRMQRDCQRAAEDGEEVVRALMQIRGDLVNGSTP